MTSFVTYTWSTTHSLYSFLRHTTDSVGLSFGDQGIATGFTLKALCGEKSEVAELRLYRGGDALDGEEPCPACRDIAGPPVCP